MLQLSKLILRAVPLKQVGARAMNVWQQAEMMQVGPLVNNSGFLRNKIYSWPLTNSCNVDFEVINFRIRYSQWSTI